MIFINHKNQLWWIRSFYNRFDKKKGPAVCSLAHSRTNAGSEYVALQSAITSGTEWLERNRPLLQAVSIPIVVSRWEDWRLHPDFLRVHTLIRAVFIQDKGFKSEVASRVALYTDNVARRASFKGNSLREYLT